MGAYGLSAELADRALARSDLDLVDMGGVGGTLAGNPLSIAATRATLEHVLTDDTFKAMIDTATYFAAGVQSVIDQHCLPWSLSQLGAVRRIPVCQSCTTQWDRVCGQRRL
jgi:glutamate-1-semialdehyde 2,1-aminomutase